MTETTVPPTTPPPSPPPPFVAAANPLLRRPDDKVLAGVCAAFGRWSGTDPVLWRVIVGVLTFFGGAGLALYAAGWLLIPKLGEDGSIGERFLAGRRRSAGDIALLVLVVLLGAVLIGDGRGLAAVLVIVVVGYLVVRERSGAPLFVASPATATVPPAGPLPADWATPAYAPPTYAGPGYAGYAGYSGAATGTPGQPVWPPAPPPREPSALGSVTLALTALVGGVLMALRLSGIEELTAPRILAACLVVVGCGLVVGTVLGRARWLFFFPGLPLAVALAVTTAVGGVVGGGVGERTWVVAGGSPTQSYELAFGEATLDLRGVDTSGRLVDVDAQVGLGHLIVIVPEDLTVLIRAKVGLGEIVDRGGEPYDGSGLRRELVIGSGDVEAEIDVEIGTGQLEVRRG